MQPNDQNSTEDTDTSVTVNETNTVSKPEATAPAAITQATPTRKNKKKLVLLGAVVAALLLIGGTAGAYFGVFLPNQPAKIAGDALGNTINSEKFKSTGFEGEVGISGGEVGDVVSSVAFEGGADIHNEAANLKVTVNTAVTKVNLELRSTDGKSAYVKLSGLTGLDTLIASMGANSTSPESAAISQFAPLLAVVNDKWFSLDESLLKQVGGGETVTGDDKITSERAEQLGKIYKKHQFLNVDKKLADQDIHGVASYHVQAKVKKEELKAFLSEVKSVNIAGLKLEQKDIDAIDKVDFSKYPFEMWVSKKDRFITQLSSSFTDKGTTYKARIAFKDINKSVTVEKPADAHSILELLGGLYSGSQGGGTNSLMSL